MEGVSDPSCPATPPPPRVTRGLAGLRAADRGRAPAEEQPPWPPPVQRVRTRLPLPLLFRRRRPASRAKATLGRGLLLSRGHSASPQP